MSESESHAVVLLNIYLNCAQELKASLCYKAMDGNSIIVVKAQIHTCVVRADHSNNCKQSAKKVCKRRLDPLLQCHLAILQTATPDTAAPAHLHLLSAEHAAAHSSVLPEILVHYFSLMTTCLRTGQLDTLPAINIFGRRTTIQYKADLQLLSRVTTVVTPYASHVSNAP